MGIGMVKIVTAEENRIPLQTMLPEAMLDCGDDFAKDLDWCDIVVIGPGIGTTYQAAEKVQWFLEAASGAAKPVILDADGLNLLAQHPEWKQYLTSRVVMTPHMGEMGRLTGKKVSELQKDRIAAARELAAETGAVCVLKDACTPNAACLPVSGSSVLLFRNIASTPARIPVRTSPLPAVAIPGRGGYYEKI